MSNVYCKRPADYVLARHCILTALGIYQVRFRRHIDGKKNRCEPGRGGEVGGSSGAQRASGLSVAEFCRRERIHPVTFYGWRRRLAGGSKRGGRAPTSRAFLPIELVTEGAARRRRERANVRVGGGVARVSRAAQDWTTSHCGGGFGCAARRPRDAELAVRRAHLTACPAGQPALFASPRPITVSRHSRSRSVNCRCCSGGLMRRRLVGRSGSRWNRTACQSGGQLGTTSAALVAEVLRSRTVHTDDTTVQRQDPEAGQWSTARFWNSVGDEAYPLTVFQYTLTHERTHPATFLRDYQGYLQADAYNGYDGIYLESGGKIIEVGCWQHARKRFKAAQASDLRAQVAMAFIKSMYAIEKRIRQHKTREWADLSIDERAERVRQVRQAETVPLLNNFGVWLRQIRGNVLPKSELGEAIRYTLNQWDALQVFTTCGLLDADNNEAERSHRGIAIGRKNWRMVGSDRGGEAAAIHFSFIASCQMNNVEPFTYLVDVLRRLPHTPREQLVDPLPHRWKPSTAPSVSPADQAANV